MSSITVTGLPRSEHTPIPAEVLAAYGSGSTLEFVEVLNLHWEETARTLTALKTHPTSRTGDRLWSVKERRQADVTAAKQSPDPGPSVRRAGATRRGF